MLVLSIGLFGILAVIITSLQLNSSSVYRTIAAQQAHAMAETLRANPTTLATTNAASGVAFSTTAASGLAVGITQSCLTAAGCAGASPAPRNEFIGTSLQMWNTQLAALLPQGVGTVCQDSTPNDGTSANWACDGAVNAPYVVKVCWSESRVSGSNAVNAGVSGGYWTGGALLCTYTNL